MGIKRVVDTSFWTDDKVIENFSPEDKLFMLYIMTNPHTTQLGIYALSKKVMAFETGYSTDTISVLLDRFETKYDLIKYSNETKELAIKNYLRHSIIKGGKPVEADIPLFVPFFHSSKKSFSLCLRSHSFEQYFLFLSNCFPQFWHNHSFFSRTLYPLCLLL